MVRMLESGVLDYILDAQAFDLEAVRSARENPNHIDLSVLSGIQLSQQRQLHLHD
jgi:citrate lyase alpha subunit